MVAACRFASLLRISGTRAACASLWQDAAEQNMSPHIDGIYKDGELVLKARACLKMLLA